MPRCRPKLLAGGIEHAQDLLLAGMGGDHRLLAGEWGAFHPVVDRARSRHGKGCGEAVALQVDAVERHLDDGQPMAALLQEPRGRLHREGDRIVIGMAALIGVGDHHCDVARDEDAGQHGAELGEAGGGALVGKAQHDLALERHAGDCQRCRQLAAPGRGIILEGGKAVLAGNRRRPRRAVGGEHDMRPGGPQQQPRRADRLVVGMGNHHRQPAGFQRLLPARQQRPEKCARRIAVVHALLSS